jgi:O-antigen/teichoic acid export membrane protein
MFGIDRTVQNTVGAEEYGFYFSLFSLTILLNILLDLGINNFNNRSIARNNQIFQKHLAGIIPLKIILAFLYALIVIIAGLILNYSVRQFQFLGILIFNQFLLSFITYLRSNISGLHFFRTDSIISVLDRVFMIVLCSILLWGGFTNSIFRIEWFILAQTLSYLLVFFISLSVVLHKSGKIRLNFSKTFSKKLLKKSYPFAILILLMSFFNRIDSVMIESILPNGKEQTGIYAQAFRILDAAAMFAALFAGLLMPIFSRMIKKGEHIGEMLKLSYSLVIVPAIILVIVSFFFRNEIIDLLYVEHIFQASKIFGILIIGFVFISTTYIFGTLLTANGNLKGLNILAGITVVINVSLNLILIKKYEAFGAAVASIISQGFFAFAQVILVKKVFNLKSNLSFLIRLLIFVLIVILGVKFSQYIFATWLVSLILAIVLALTSTWILKIITPSSIFQILKSET